MINGMLSDENILYSNIYRKRVNLASTFKGKNKMFLDNIKYIELVKSLGCNVTEASLWLTDNFLYIQNRITIV